MLAHFLSMHVFLHRERVSCDASVRTHAKVAGNHIPLTAERKKNTNSREKCNFSPSNLFVSHMKWQQFWLRWDKYMHEVDCRRGGCTTPLKRPTSAVGEDMHAAPLNLASAGKKKHARGGDSTRLLAEENKWVSTDSKTLTSVKK